MDYIYDIVLNFQDDYYDYYEWKTTDKIINAKKIPIYKINSNDYLNIKRHNTKIDISSLPKHNKIFLLTSGFEIIGLMIDNIGNVLKKSSLIFEEADDILEDANLIKKINLKYDITKKKKTNYKSRGFIEKTSHINNYLKNIDINKDEYILKYLYFDIYNKEEKDIKKIYQDIKELTKKNPYEVYNHISNINLELKKSFPN